MRHKWQEQERFSISPEEGAWLRSIKWWQQARRTVGSVIRRLGRTVPFTLKGPIRIFHLSFFWLFLLSFLHNFLEASSIVSCTAHITLMSPGCVSKCSYDYGCVRLSVSADWRRLIPIRDDCDPCDIIVPDVNHLTTSNQELHPVIDPSPTVLCPHSAFTDPSCQISKSNTIEYFCTEGVQYIFYKVA